MNRELKRVSGIFFCNSSKKLRSCVVNTICLSIEKATFLKRSMMERILMSSKAWIGSSMNIQSMLFPSSSVANNAFARNMQKERMLIWAVLKYKFGTILSFPSSLLFTNTFSRGFLSLKSHLNCISL